MGSLLPIMNLTNLQMDIAGASNALSRAMKACGDHKAVHKQFSAAGAIYVRFQPAACHARTAE